MADPPENQPQTQEQKRLPAGILVTGGAILVCLIVYLFFFR
jgi:hypothetical protein